MDQSWWHYLPAAVLVVINLVLLCRAVAVQRRRRVSAVDVKVSIPDLMRAEDHGVARGRSDLVAGTFGDWDAAREGFQDARSGEPLFDDADPSYAFGWRLFHGLPQPDLPSDAQEGGPGRDAQGEILHRLAPPRRQPENNAAMSVTGNAPAFQAGVAGSSPAGRSTTSPGERDNGGSNA